jgi:hypothetical protein
VLSEKSERMEATDNLSRNRGASKLPVSSSSEDVAMGESGCWSERGSWKCLFSKWNSRVVAVVVERGSDAKEESEW